MKTFLSHSLFIYTYSRFNCYKCLICLLVCLFEATAEAEMHDITTSKSISVSEQIMSL
jgi:hypothetical protein